MVYSSANIDNISVCQAAIFKCLTFGFTAFLSFLVRMVTFRCKTLIVKWENVLVCAFLPGFTISIALESTDKQLRRTTSDVIDVCAK